MEQNPPEVKESLLFVRCRVSCFVRLNLVTVVESVTVELRFWNIPVNKFSLLFVGVLDLELFLM